MRVRLGVELWLAEINGEQVLMLPWAQANGHPAPGIADPKPIVIHEGEIVDVHFTIYRRVPHGSEPV